MTKILITGANSNLGKNLLKVVITTTDYEVIALASEKQKIEIALEEIGCGDQVNQRVTAVSNQVFLNGCEINDIDIAIHMAFARRFRSDAEIADSIVFAKKIFQKCEVLNIPNIINLSSAGIYGNQSEARTEETIPAPDSLYSMAKYATEIIFDTVCQNAKKKTNLRLCSVMQSQRLVQELCRQAKEDKVIKLIGGMQRFSYIDIEDAAEALLAFIKYEGNWKPAYNIANTGNVYSLVEIAEIVSDITAQTYGYKPEIVIEPKNIQLNCEVNGLLFETETGWKAKYKMRDMICRIWNG